MSCGRRRALAVLGGAAAGCVLPGVQAAASHRLQLGISLPATHPISAGLVTAGAELLRESGGRLAIEVRPDGQLGTDTEMIARVRSGELALASTAGQVWGTVVPVASIHAVAFAFAQEKAVWQAMDGELGAHVRAGFAAAGLVTPSRIWDHGLRHVTHATRAIAHPGDLAGLKLRVPASPMLLSLFRGLGAQPVSVPFGELHGALQRGDVEGQENPLTVVEAARLYEVQKHCSYTAHAWDGFWLAAGQRGWNALPADLRQLAVRVFDAQALRQRAASAVLNASLQVKLKDRGMRFHGVDAGPFREALRRAGYYEEWRGRFGSKAWALLEQASGALA